MNLHDSFKTTDRIELGKFYFTRIDDTAFEAYVECMFYTDPIVEDVKILGAEVKHEGLNVLIAIADGRYTCLLTPLRPASVVAKEFAFGQRYGDIERNVATLKKVEEIINLRPYYATEETLFCEICGDFSSQDIDRIFWIASRIMAPEALDDLSPVEFAARFRELRFSYSP